MADAVNTTVLMNTQKHLVLLFTNVSDGIGEGAVKKLDVASAVYGTGASYKCTGFIIRRIQYCICGMQLKILWDADTDDLALVLNTSAAALNVFGEMDFREYGGINNPKSTGYTGNINFTTVGHSAGDVYTVVLELEKVP